MDIIEEAFAPVYGKPCWGMRYDCQTNLAMNFGAPRLKIREPYETKSKSRGVQQSAAHRLITLRGQWWLWIFCAYWRAYKGEKFIGGFSSSFQKGKIAAHYIEGQKLVRVNVNELTGATRFEFDLGGIIDVSRLRKYEPASDLWMLYKPNGYVLSVHGDGTYDHAPGSGIDHRKGVSRRPLRNK